MKEKFIVIFLIGFVAILSLIGYSIQKNEQAREGEVTLIITSIGRTTQEKFNLTGISALELLEKGHNITGGFFAICIDDICAEGKYKWSFYVNEKLSIEGPTTYKLNGGDKIEFRFTDK